jgi:hypothetical protein
LIFSPGSTQQVFTVAVVGDMNNEPDQTFLVLLSSPVSATIARGTAIGTILNDDAASGRLLRFAFDSIGSTQYAGQPFPLTIRAQDHLAQPATFSGMAVLSAQTDQFESQLAGEDFEDGNLAGWTNFATASLQFSNSTDNAASGLRSLRLSGKASSAIYTSSLRYVVTNSRPNHVRFNVRAAQTNAVTGRFWLVGNPGYRACDFYLNKDGRMGLSTAQGFAGVAYQSNHWYAVDLGLDWTNKTVNCLIDGALAVTNTVFPDSLAASADYIAVQNSEVGVSWFDDFQLLNRYFTNLIIAPSNIAGFVNGVWTGPVTVQPAATNVYLTVSDLQEHVGTSGLFQLLLPEIVRFAQWQRLPNGWFQMSVEARPGQTYTLLASTNLADWVPALSFLYSNTPTVIVDSNAPSYQRRFYRITR